MTATQLNTKKLEIIRMVMDSDDDELISALAARFRAAADYLRPMTMEEFHARIDQAEEDIAAGRVYTQEEMERWINELDETYLVGTV